MGRILQHKRDSGYLSGNWDNRLGRKTLNAARTALRSPRTAATGLLANLQVTLPDPAFLEAITNCFADWRGRTPISRQELVAQTLWGFEKACSIISYRGPGDLALPNFCARYAYPIGKFIALLPPYLLVEPLFRILTTDTDPAVLQYAAYSIGQINYPHYSEPLHELRKLRTGLTNRAKLIGDRWQLAQRQILYTEVQLGNESAELEFLRKLTDSAVGHFEAAYNFGEYYGGDKALVKFRFEQRLDEKPRTDINTRRILLKIYDHIRTSVHNTANIVTVDPTLWIAS
jgi:hypothetical protein